MKVFKFGGASVNSTAAVKNMAKIVEQYADEPLVVVVSAMGKTTNMLEQLVPGVRPIGEHPTQLEQIYNYHIQIVQGLFPDTNDPIYSELTRLFDQLKQQSSQAPSSYNYDYAQTVCFGELISTTIISHYLNSIHLENKWVDIRQVIRTDYNYREGHVDFAATQEASRVFDPMAEKIYITQGFIAGTPDGHTTTLGR